MKEKLPKIATITTDHLILRPLTLADANDVFAYAQKPEVSQYVYWKPHQTIDDSKIFIQEVMEAYETEHKQMWAVTLKTNNQLIGTCGFMAYYPTTKMLELGYALNPLFWKKGYTSQALEAIIAYAFKNLDIIRIEGICVTENVASANAMKRCNLKFEGLLHDAFIKDEVIKDCHLYAITRRQYQSE